MTTHLPRSVVCPILIGRGAQLEALDLALEQAYRGEGGTLLISGEAGVGKSRLIAETKRRAAAAGARVLQGNCFEPDSSLPFARVIDLLEAYCLSASSETIRSELGPYAPVLLKLAPELALSFPGVDPAPRSDPEQEKRQFFQTLVHVFARIAAGCPLLIVLEDLHWADVSSLEFAFHLARRVEGRAILLLGSYRSDEVGPNLGHTLSEIDRLRLAAELSLRRLDPAEVTAMLRAIFPSHRPVTPGFLHRLYALTDGNPFFVEEILTSVVGNEADAPGHTAWDHASLSELEVPRGVQDVIQRRLTQVRPVAREIALPAAVIGQRFEFGLLQEITALDEPDLLDALKELLAAHLIVDAGEDRFLFRHALTRQAIYSSLLPRERRAAHRAVVDTLLRLAPATADPPIAELAYHAYEARAWLEALDYGRQAAERATAIYAPREAVEQYARAIVAAERLRGNDATQSHVPDSLVIELLTRRGQAYETLGEFQHALDDYTRALAIAESGDHPETVWQALVQLGMLWAGRDYAQSGVYFERALSLAQALDDPELLAHSLNRVGNWRLNAGQPLEAVRLHQEALIVFQRIDDPTGMAATFDLLGLASYHRVDLVGSTGYYDQAVTLWRRIDDRLGLTSSLTFLAARGGNADLDSLAVGMDDVAAGVRAGEESIRLAQSIGWRGGEAFAFFMLGLAVGVRGDYPRAFELARVSLEIAEEIEHLQWMTAAHRLLGGLYLDLLSLDDARRHLERSRDLALEIDSSFWVQSTGSYLAGTYILQGAWDDAAALLDGLVATDAPVAPIETLGQALIAYARIQLDLERHNPLGALQLAERLAHGPVGTSPRLEWLRCAALVGLRRFDEAASLLPTLLAAVQAKGLLPLSWRLQALLATTLRATGHGGVADSALDEGRRIIEQIAGGLSDVRLRTTFATNASAYLLDPVGGVGDVSSQGTPGGLTPREAEVAALIARGLGNAEIAAALYVTKRTVETHISSIRAKLGYTSRMQIALWAADAGLPSPDLSTPL